MLRGVGRWWRFRQAVLTSSQREIVTPAGARDVVLIPCWRRAEFLWHCLSNLSLSKGIADLSILIRPDTGYSPDNLEVIRAFADRLPNLIVDFPVPCPHRRTKQSANVLLGYLRAAALAQRFVYLVEEDVMVARDFFLWHRAVHSAAGELFCSIAVKNPNRAHQLSGDPEAFYLNNGDYCSYGVCFDRRVLRRYIAPHVNPQYLRSPKRYLRRHFPTSQVSLGYVEQDGLLRRIQEQSQLAIAYPCLPRAFDAGYYGYNRPGGIEGSLHDRVQRLESIIYDPERIRDLVAAEFTERCVTISLQPPDWKSQRRTSVPLC